MFLQRIVRRSSRSRLIIYIGIVGVLIFCSSLNKPSSPSVTQIDDIPEPIHHDDDSDPYWSALDDTTTLPWYTHPHPALPVSNNYSTGHLSLDQRQALWEHSVERAGQVAELVLGPIQGIPGSVHRTHEAADRVRAQIDCWTSQGQWKQQDGYHLAKHFQDPLYGKCKRQKDPYVWSTPTTTCHLDDTVDPVTWCSLLDGRNMLVVGDLVQYQLHEVLLDAMRDGPTVCFGELNCKDHTLCQQPEARMRYIRNDILSPVSRINRAKGHPSVDTIEWPFITSPMMRAYSVLILNRAPVVEDDETFIQQLVETMRVIRSRAPDTLILYRSTSIGHPFCNDAQAPLESPLKDEELRQLPYGWSELKRRNAMARKIVEAAGGVFVDLAALTDLRPDGHMGGQDCLRYCIPGPLDAWVQVLYHVFLSLAQ